MAATAVDKAKTLLQERRDELKLELKQIEQALSDLGGARRGPGRPRGSRNGASTANDRKRRRRRGGTRAEHALKHVTEHPGANATEIASAMGIKPNYVYRVMAELEKDGKVAKQGKGYHVADDAAGA